MNTNEAIDLNPKSFKNVYFSDKEKVGYKIHNIINDGIDKLHIISDYDMTLTSYLKDGKKNRNSHAVLEDTEIVSDNFKAKGKQLFEKYYPLEISHSISHEEKYEKMVEFWNLTHQVYIEENISRVQLEQALNGFDMPYRNGADILLEKAYQKNIPFLVFSAGLADVIEHLLKKVGYLKSNVHVISNRMKFDNNPPYNLIAFEDPLIHILNKGEVCLKQTAFYEQVENRSNAILLGDSLGDINMKGNLEHENLLSIGFLNHDKSNLLDKYLDTFDVVITDDGSFEWLNHLLESIN